MPYMVPVNEDGSSVLGQNPLDFRVGRAGLHLVTSAHYLTQEVGSFINLVHQKVTRSTTPVTLSDPVV